MALFLPATVGVRVSSSLTAGLTEMNANHDLPLHHVLGVHRDKVPYGACVARAV